MFRNMVSVFSAQSKILFKWLLASVGIIITFLLVFDYNPYVPLSITTRLSKSLIVGNFIQNSDSIDQIGLGIPMQFKIPRININAIVESVGLTSAGALDVPKSYTNTAWFNLGPRPGEIGSAVIDGHSGWKDGVQSVFDGLNKIQIGDKIYIEDDKGSTITFVVRSFRTYGPNEDATDIFNSSDKKAHLNLITCIGAWYVNQKSPNDRFVVFSDKE